MNVKNISVADFRESLRGKGFDEVIDIHLKLTAIIQKEYKLSADERHLNLAIHACELMISISDVVMDAMIKKARYQIYEYEKIVGAYPHPRTFYRPSHYGYNKLSVILKKKKDIVSLKRIQDKCDAEGWGKGLINISEIDKGKSVFPSGGKA
ncbi:hypothetical protein RJE46_13985 [Cedecea neteri]|uniref:hypothetical protein n=1 Tax=Cedecea neteri TaxID=158822 RepID=UPI002893513B|nr:hypothetical protein [Cedecea neteri]WNJ77743.1 hypothetical protein RJE46_13985 [Cedecea neteri]